MRSSVRRLLLLLAAVPIVVLIATMLYMVLMGNIEKDPRTFWQALGWAIETFTTTGYGTDAHWKHPVLVLFVGLVQFFGVFIIYLVFPFFLIPFLEQRFEVRLPRSVDRLQGHVVVYGYSASVDSFLERVALAGSRAVVIEEDEGVARRLFDRGLTVVQSRLEEGALQGACIESARALVANSSDERDAAVILAARQVGFAGTILALAEEPLYRQPLILSGADHVFTPRHVIGAALAAKASSRVSPHISGIQHIGSLDVLQVRVQRGSALAGKTLEEMAIGERTGATIIGQWVAGRLRVPPTPSMVLEPGGILVVIGTEESVEKLGALCQTVTLRRSGPILVAGYGEVGHKVCEVLRDAGEEVRVIDRNPIDGADIVGNVLDPSVYEAVDLSQVRALILALDSDSAMLFATVIIKDLAPDLPVIARVNEVVNLERIHWAGADFALSMSQVSGQILARRILGEEAISVDPLLKVLKVDAGRLAGSTPATTALRRRTGVSVVAIERDGEVLTSIGPDVIFEAGDRLFLCGPEEAVERARELFR